MQTVNNRLCGNAVDMCDFSAFEQFVQTFHGSLLGTTFVPLGGMHDGGADGFVEQIFESKARAGTFLQASKTTDIQGKIAQTLKRLKDFGRSPNVVMFYFSVPISQIDSIEEYNTNKHNITVRIRAKQYIETHINDSPQTIQAFNSYLRPSILHLLEVGSTGNSREFPFDEKALCAFLGQEVNRRRGNSTLLTSLTDSLILWSLEGTDPDKSIFLDKNQIQAKIEGAIPAAKQFIRGNIKHRLDKLSSKHNGSGRQISFHKKLGSYALKYEERQKLVEENIKEAEIINKVSDSIFEKLRLELPSDLHVQIPIISSAILECIEELFRKQGMVLSLYINDKDDDLIEEINLTNVIDQKVDALNMQADSSIKIKSAIIIILRSMIYNPSNVEHDYLLRLSNTYFILFSIKNDPKIVEYFSGMAEKLYLYVGSDLIIKALSEYHLPDYGRLITNSLRILRESGATLVMAEPAFEEVFTHLRAAVLEFENFYAPVESAIDEEFVPYIDRIIIRAYFYAKLDINVVGRKPKGWMSYINQFCDYDDLKRNKNRETLRMYLCDKFSLRFEERKTMLSLLDREDLKSLTNNITNERKKLSTKGDRVRVLAYNDALHALRVYSKRHEIGEITAPTPFGYKTWWLTHERTVQRVALTTLENRKSRFIMRPEFLLNYIYLMPTKSEIIESYRNIFPTILGVSLSRRAPRHTLHNILISAREAYSVDSSRSRVMLKNFSDLLKSDQIRIYDHNLDGGEPGTLDYHRQPADR
ncbi:hypothetical protein [Methylobacterium sp. SyP6R]|uniref:hypothetical protein n=1 Tax=Methylobacterium sp. SyP6R TaxID=2718876 RepID=UPI001F476CFF|nr:hypothetical protein [Methylobacterium sp. SyP6R]MCF4125688.1 hypothetical protein [Methylobacterium sp. SyP6R]